MKIKILLSTVLLFAVLGSKGQWTRDSLSEGTIRMAGATLGTKAYFAGGQIGVGSNWVETDKVEIYDIATGTWQMEYLTEARVYAIGVTCGDRVFVAGGIYNFPMDPSSRVDIYNSQGYWGSTELSVPRFAISAVSNDSLALFAGGANIVLNESYDVVNIYNINTNQWSIAHLSEPRGGMGCAVTGDLAFFAGGENTVKSDRVDIYHFSTGAWETASLSQARTWIGATVAQNKVIFAGGVLDGGALSDRVDIYDTETYSWTIATLSMARGFFTQQAVTVCGKAYFVGGNNLALDYDTIDVYDPVNDDWSVMTMPNRLTDHTVVAIDSSILIAGGFTFTNYPYGEPQKYVEIWTDPTVGIFSQHIEAVHIKVYPNPSSDNIQLEIPYPDHQKPLQATIYNLQGQVVSTQILEPGNLEMNLDLPAGVYVLRIIADNVAYSELITIK